MSEPEAPREGITRITLTVRTQPGALFHELTVDYPTDSATARHGAIEGVCAALRGWAKDQPSAQPPSRPPPTSIPRSGVPRQ